MKNIPHCRRCGKTEREVALIKNAKYINKKGEISYSHTCNPCNTDKLKQFRKTKVGKLSVAMAVKKYERRNAIKVKSWRVASCIPLLPCVVCGNKRADRHHEDSTKPLEVVMLCRKHHKEAHRQKALKLV